MGFAEDGVEGDGANPPREADWWERGGGGIGRVCVVSESKAVDLG